MISEMIIVDAVAIKLARYDLSIGLRFKQEFFSSGTWHSAPDILRKLTSYWEQKFYHCASALYMDTCRYLPLTDDPYLWLMGFDNIVERAAGTIHWGDCHG